MPLLIGLGVGVGVGGLKYGLVDEPQYEKKKALAASTQRFSPWTGMKAQAPDQPSAVGDALTYGSQGAMMGQGIGNAQAMQGLAGAQANWLNNQPYSNMPLSPWNQMYSGYGPAGNLA